MPNGKTREESFTVMTELVLPNDTNLLGNLLGGRLLHWIDIAGAMAATRHSEGLVATVLMDAVEFKHPIKLGSIVTFVAYVVWTGNTSIETTVEIYREEPGLAASKSEQQGFGNCSPMHPGCGVKELINKVNVIFVALRASAQKRNVVPYIPVTEQEKKDYAQAVKRRSAKSNNQS